MSDIRVTYSGLIGLIVSIIGFVTGTFFVVLVTRRLSPEDFGVWTLIGSLVGYVAIVEPLVNIWSTRQIARGEQIGKTALFTSGLFSIIGFVAYSIVVIFVSASLHTNLFVLLLASALIPLTFLNNSLNSICGGSKPQLVSYGIIAFESSKVPLGIFFVVLLQMGIIGALLTAIGASLFRLVIVMILAREIIVGAIKYQIIKFWLRMSWLTLYMSSPGLLRSLDTLVFSLVTNSLIGLAFWGAANTISSQIGQLATVSQGLYPKLLATRKKEFAEQNLKTIMYFAIPSLGASIVFAKPILHILNPLYVDAVYVVIILATRSFVTILMDFFFGILRAYEGIDLDKQASFKQYIKSKLFLLPTLNYILYGSYIAILAYFLIFFKTTITEEVDKVTLWSFIFLVVTCPFMIYGLIAVKKQHKIGFPYVAAMKFSAVTLLASTVIFFISEKTLTYTQSVWDFIPQFIPIFVIGGVIYFGLTYLIDESARKLLNSIISGILGK